MKPPTANATIKTANAVEMERRRERVLTPEN
jgi:hypothetical protein